MKGKSFSELFKSAYNGYEHRDIVEFAEKQAIHKSLTGGLGHPEYEDIELFEVVPGNLVVLFMDIRGFTKLSIALDNEELIRILQSITVASILSVRNFGGYIAEFTGDGIMAYFGGRQTAEDDAFNALNAAAHMIKEIKGPVNAELNGNGDESVKVGMGLEFGNVLWTRLGLNNSNQVKPISEVNFISGKSSGQAKSWEIVVGQNLAEWIPDEFKDDYETYSFQKNKETYEYNRYLFKWEKYNTAKEARNIEQAMKSKKLPAIKPIFMSSTGAISTGKSGSTGPRPLKDKPFFGGK
ncbi:MAG: adenylate/guanylate cyclase domain-containing protein [Bacillota bacterium]|nr:adenylate/guanylate cyclase domain-containing protein [Bacillota bacterium]